MITLSIATSESWKNELQHAGVANAPSMHRVVIFNEGLGKIAERYLEKGAKVYPWKAS